jgi:hypothetical protein
MPRFNGRGPNNKGPMTGKGLGFCNFDNDEEIAEHIQKILDNDPRPRWGLRRNLARGKFGRRGFGRR